VLKVLTHSFAFQVAVCPTYDEQSQNKTESDAMLCMNMTKVVITP
jgi:hypothetical protein